VAKEGVGNSVCLLRKFFETREEGILDSRRDRGKKSGSQIARWGDRKNRSEDSRQPDARVSRDQALLGIHDAPIVTWRSKRRPG